jgi:FkbM family methyltransferase
MNLFSVFRYPVYLYHPRQVFTRLRRQFQKPREDEVVRLAWGHPLLVRPDEFIGHALWTQGIFELDVCEAIARLVREGDTVVDVGANVGFMTSLLARAAGNAGNVLAFEPHPGLYRRLQANINLFSNSTCSRVIAEPVALTDHEGEDWLVFDSRYLARNSGTAGLSGVSFARGADRLKVRTSRLDQFVGDKVVALLKLDVEGAELQVLLGANRALTERRIKAVVYEDFHAATSGIANHLKGFGFSVFHLDGNLIGPRILEVHENFHQVQRGRDENFLAVLDSSALARAYRRRGWRVFSL